MTYTEKPAPPGDLVDDLGHELLKLKSLTEILKRFGIDPVGPTAERLALHMVAGLYHGIQRIPKTPPSQPAAKRHEWTSVHDLTLLLDVEWSQSNHFNKSEREAVKVIARAFPPETDRFPYKQNRRGTESPKSDLERYEAALWSRWMNHVKPARARLKWMDALGVIRPPK
jgi:hypothetical protein